MMLKLEKNLYYTLNSYHKLGSPQINSFNPLDKLSISSFSFHFKDLDKTDKIYPKLISWIENFSGGLPWIMHSYGSRKNYTIEPLEIYVLKRKYGIDYISFLSKNGHEEIAVLSQKDMVKLCGYIKKKIFQASG
ncbi:hypothetical protein [Flagellimonas onchidii]|uniref:hypothetical protein n=1 Tax=Flagellimonas onchidii TaxID=2562684 RepID=UPI0010A65C46|nr:hypothetical protein [Allomuricauda onchidii]